MKEAKFMPMCHDLAHLPDDVIHAATIGIGKHLALCLPKYISMAS